MNKPTTYQAYYKANVQTSDQLNLIILLYDGLLRFLKKAAVKIEGQELEEAHNYLVRSKNIVQELLSTLKIEEGGEVAQNLRELYLYCFRKIVEANLRKDVQLIQDVIKVIDNLKQGWLQIKAERQQQRPETLREKGQKLSVHG